MTNSFLSFDKPLYRYCFNASNREGDTFVGIKSEIIDGKHSISIHFPLGYEISQDETLVRDEIIELLNVLQEYNDEQSRISSITKEQLLKTVRFPVQAYHVVLMEYLNNGVYKIKENEFVKGNSGPISWNKTRKMINPIVTQNGFIYPEFMVRHHNETDKDLISEINRYCIYESHLKLGFLYKLPMPNKVFPTKDIEVYKKYLNGMWLQATKDTDKALFRSMLDILEFTNNENEPEEFYFGTNRFEYIWEKLIDAMYGIKGKDEYFPKTKWLLNIGRERENRAIEPDTIMKNDRDIYVLDAKYYKYGVTKKPTDLPESSSINKQISYGEFIATNNKFKLERDNGMKVFNAFLMPYNKLDKPYNDLDSNYYSIGEAVVDWKDSSQDYERVQGILLDVKFLIKNQLKPNNKEIKILSEKIIESLNKNKEKN